MRETAGSAAAPAARRKNFRRGSFIGSSSLIALSHARTWARARPAFAEPTLERAVGWRRTLATLELAHPRPEGCDHSQPAGKHAPCCEPAPPPIGGYVVGPSQANSRTTGRFRPTSLRIRSTLSLARERDAISSLD